MISPWQDSDWDHQVAGHWVSPQPARHWLGGDAEPGRGGQPAAGRHSGSLPDVSAVRSEVTWGGEHGPGLGHAHESHESPDWSPGSPGCCQSSERSAVSPPPPACWSRPGPGLPPRPAQSSPRPQHQSCDDSSQDAPQSVPPHQPGATHDDDHKSSQEGDLYRQQSGILPRSWLSAGHGPSVGPRARHPSFSANLWWPEPPLYSQLALRTRSPVQSQSVLLIEWNSGHCELWGENNQYGSLVSQRKTIWSQYRWKYLVICSTDLSTAHQNLCDTNIRN